MVYSIVLTIQIGNFPNDFPREREKKLLEIKWVLHPFKPENVSILGSVTALKIVNVNKSLSTPNGKR